MLGVGRESRNLLRSILRQLLYALVFHIIYIVFCRERASVYPLSFRFYQQGRTVRTYYVVADSVQVYCFYVVGVKQNSSFFSSLERVFYDLVALIADAGILVGAFYRIDTTDISGRELAAGNVMQRDWLRCNYL